MSYDPIDDAMAQRYELSLDQAKQRITGLESEVAALRAEVETAKDRAVKYQVERNTLVVENSKLRQQVEGMREDAERYRWLRDDAPVAEIDINEMIYTEAAKTDEAFDAARKESSNG